MSNIKLIPETGAIKWTTFSDGSETCKISGEISSVVRVQCDVKDATKDLIRLGLVKDALERLGVKETHLTMFYFPQARADRVFEEGMPLPVKVFANILNSYKFTSVCIEDPHSDVTSALIDNVEVISQTNSIERKLNPIERDLPSFTVCAPDLGATKKVFDVVSSLGKDNYIQAIKVRDVKTGNIVKCDLIEDKVDGNILIVDDISDGGASFKFLAKKLKEKGASKVGLFVTHGIFSQGLTSLEEDIDYIWCNNIIGDYINVKTLSDFNNRH